MSAHRLNRDLAYSPFNRRKDPGDAGVLHVDMSLVAYSLVSGEAETRVLATPQEPGIQVTLSMHTDGGDIVISTAGDETILDGTTVGISVTLDDAGDAVHLVSYIGSAGQITWLVLGNNGATLNAA